MSFEQAKIYCSENILRNIVILARGSGLSAKQIQVIDTQIKTNVIDYLQAKYPLTDSTEINKRLEEIVREVDNIQSLDNNYFTNSQIVFEYREQGNYNDLIMKMINDLMNLVDKEVDPQRKSELTNFGDFQKFMTQVFEKVEDEDWMRKQDKEQVMSQLKMSHNISLVQGSQIKSPDQHPAEYKQRMRKHNQQKDKYRSKVKEYTSYLIGRKIPENAPTYTEKEIINMNMTIKSPTVLRILTKWCDQLWEKYESGSYYSDRSDSIKVQRGGFVNSLLVWMRNDLDQILRSEKEGIKEYMEELAEDNYQMQNTFLEREIQRKDTGDEHVEQLERIGGKFSLKVVNIMHSYIITFLNRLIHGLLKAAKKFHEDNKMGEYPNWPSPANLLTFKIGDLMRCKFSSKEKEIIRLYKELQRISRQTRQKLQIIRIKNRLRSGTNDLLINVKFNNIVLCEIQLAVKVRASDFIKCSNLFHHYLYELKRSRFGPLTELCSIWSSLDRKSQVYHDLLDAEQLKVDHKDHTCEKLRNKHEMVRYERSFVCSQCSRTYLHNNYLRSHTRCNLCGFIKCARCKLGQENDEDLISSLITNTTLKNQCQRKVSAQQPLPKLGAYVLIESKLPIAEVATYMVQKTIGKQYIFAKDNDRIYEIQNIANEKKRRNFRGKYIVFELNPNKQYSAISDSQAKKSYILPTQTKKNYIKQKESISLMSQALTTKQCKQILSIGTRAQKETVQNLFLTDNKLEELPFNSEEFPNLKWITISRNNITNFAGLQKCHNLTNIIGFDCKLKQIPSEIYSLYNIQKMVLSKNSIQSIPDQIENLTKLTHLQLETCTLPIMPQSLFLCKNLISINLQDNKITALPQDICKLQKLQTFACNKNLLAKLPQRFGELKNLKQLNISINSLLAVLPDSFSNLQKLQTFNASKTILTSLPEQFGKLTKLKTLQLSFCLQMKSLPSSINQLKNLQKINLSSCTQIKLPETFGELIALKNLNLGSCGLNQLPNSFSNLKRLQILDLSKNNMQSMNSKNFLQNSTQLIELRMTLCQLNMFPNLSSCRKLKKILLNNNQITQIIKQYIENCTNLQQLRISDNKLKPLPHILTKFSKLIIFQANKNSLIHLIEDVDLQEMKISGGVVWPNLKQFILDNNLLEEIPFILLKCSKLVNLTMDNNKIKEIPNEISNLKSLSKMYFRNNLIKVVPASLQKIATLKYFYINGCPIDTLEAPQWLINKKVDCGNFYNYALNLARKAEQEKNKQARNKINEEIKNKEQNQHGNHKDQNGKN